MPDQQFFYSCVAVAGSLFARRIVIVVLSQRDIATAYNKDHAYFIVSEVLGTLKKGSSSNHHYCRRRARSWPLLECVHPSTVFFINIGALNDEANSNVATPATITSIVYHGRSWLYTSVMVAMVIYHTSCPAGPRYDESHSYLHLRV